MHSTKSLTLKQKMSRIGFVLTLAVISTTGVYMTLFSHAATGCTTTVSSLAAAQAAVTTAAGGSVVCLTPGNYGADLVLTGTHASNVTIQPDPSLDPNGAGKVTVNSVSVTGTFMTVRNFYITRGVSVRPISRNIVIDHNDVTNAPGGGGVGLFCTAAAQPGCSFITISGNRLHNMTNTNLDGDVVLIKGWANVTVTANEFVNDGITPGQTGHHDCFQSDNAGLNTAHDLSFDHNYMHDVNCEWLVKDGDIAPGLSVSNNLLVRAGSGAGSTLHINENTNGLVIRNNTYIGASGALQTGGSAPNPTATVDHNIFGQFNFAGTPRYALTEDYNIFTAGNQWSFDLAAHDLPRSGNAINITYSPVYLCGGSCGNGSVAGDDYRLASNPNGIGINWAPSQYNYGPVYTPPATPPPPRPTPSPAAAPTTSQAGSTTGTSGTTSTAESKSNKSDNQSKSDNGSAADEKAADQTPATPPTGLGFASKLPVVAPLASSLQKKPFYVRLLAAVGMGVTLDIAAYFFVRYLVRHPANPFNARFATAPSAAPTSSGHIPELASKHPTPGTVVRPESSDEPPQPHQ